MLHVCVLHEATYNQNGIAFRFPLWLHRCALRERGIDVRFAALRDDLVVPTCDVLCVSSRAFSPWWAERESEILAFLARARSIVRRILWFDVSDSTGTTHFRVLPYVDGYVKNQLLRDRRAYLRTYYGSRPYTDFIHERFGVEDTDPGEPHLNHIPNPRDLAKLAVGWNSGFFHYGRWGEPLGKLWCRVPWIPVRFPSRWDAPLPARPIALSCRIGIQYTRATIAASRQRIRDILTARGTPTEKVNRRVYVAELRRSLAACSPFGLGEISLRDFEVIVAGAAMVKQDMSHLETWPDLWIANETYLPFRWDLTDLVTQVERAVREPARMVAIARAAQERYRRATVSEEGAEEFCARFAALVC